MQKESSLGESNRSMLKQTSKTCLIGSGMLNETAISPVNVDASMTKTSRMRFAVNNLFSRTNLDLGQFNDSKLSPLYQSHYEQTHRGEVICLAYIDKDDQLAITEEALRLFKQYESNPITFIGNMGKKNSGKSFWYDKILNLSEVEGAQYSKTKTNHGLYIWSVPFVKNNLRIFLLDHSDNRNTENFSGQDEKLLDLEIILSQALVLIPDPQDKKMKIADVAYSNLNSSMGRLSDRGSKTTKDTGYWPQFFYCLYRSIKSVSPQQDKLSYLFADYNYSIIHNALNSKLKENVSQLTLMESSMIKGEPSSRLLNETYVKRTSTVFRDIYRKLNGKKYEGLTQTGQILPFILMHAAKNLNSSKNIKLEKMFNDIKKDIYDKKFQAAKFIYDLNYNPLQQPANASQHANKNTEKIPKSNLPSLKDSRKVDQNEILRRNANKQDKQLVKVRTENASLSQSHLKSILQENKIQASILKPKPRPLDEVLGIFRKTNQNVLKDYHQTKYDTLLHEQYERKLLNYGQTKEKHILSYNKKQSYVILSSILPNFPQPMETIQLNSQSVLNFMDKLKKTGLPLDHDRSNPISQKLKDLTLLAKKNDFFHVWMTQAHYKLRKLEMTVEEKKKELLKLKYEKNAVIVLNSHKDNEAEDIKDELNRSTDKIDKVKTELYLSKKLNIDGITDREYLKELQTHKQKLERALKENDKKLKQIDLTPSKDPRINLLQQKLDDKKTIQLQIQAGLSTLVHSRLNNSSMSVLSARKSEIRRIGDGGIKKSHLNKSMTK